MISWWCGVEGRHQFSSLLTSLQHLMQTVIMRDYWRKWQCCIMNRSNGLASVWVHIALIRWQEMSCLSPGFTTIFSLFEPVQHLQTDPRNGGLILNLVQKLHSSYHAYLHQREQDAVKCWPRTANAWRLVVPEWRTVNPCKAEIMLRGIKTNQQLKYLWRIYSLISENIF